MQGRCDKHLFEEAVDVCRSCGYEFCNDCLVYAFGPKQPPFCVSCAVAAAGIRRAAGNQPSMTKADRKRMLKERKSYMAKAAHEAKAEAKALRRGGGQLAPDLVGTPAPAPATENPGIATTPAFYTPPRPEPRPEVTPAPAPEPAPALAYEAPDTFLEPMTPSRPSFEEAAAAAAAPEPVAASDTPASTFERAETDATADAPARRAGHPIGFPWVQPEVEPRRAAG